MAKMITVSDSNYRRGMNSLDDPKALSDGECAALVNALPGYPLKPRKGSDFTSIIGGVTLESKPFYVPAKMWDGSIRQWVFFWVKNGNNEYSLHYVNLEDDTLHDVVVGIDYATFYYIHPRRFDFQNVDGIVYAMVSYSFAAQPPASMMYAIEVFGAAGFIAREIPPADIDSASIRLSVIAQDANDGTFHGEIFFGYTYTFVKRGNQGEYRTDYVPGDMETAEAVSSRIAFARPASTNVSPVANLSVGMEIMRPINLEQYGFTHIRLYRTRNLIGGYSGDLNSDGAREFAAGADKYFLMDVPIPSNVGVGTLISVEDTVSIGAHLGEMNQLASFGYTMPPHLGRNMLYFKDRLFMGTDYGQVFFSEIPGGDGGGDVGFAQEQKAKYALWFKPTDYRLDLDIEEGVPITGLASLGDDLYIFKQNKVYTIVGGDPLTAPWRTVSDTAGCPYPNAITKCIVDGQEALFFLSGVGPMLIMSGGYVKPFDGFKVKDLWPDAGNGWIKPESCSASFWNNTLWLSFETKDGDKKTFGYLSSGDDNGSFEVTHPYSPLLNRLVVSTDGRALSICEVSGYIFLVNFLGRETSTDRYSGALSGTLSMTSSITMSLRSRKIYPGPEERSVSELFRLVGYCRPINKSSPFVVYVESNRRKTTFDSYSSSAVFQSAYPNSAEAVRRSIDFMPKADFIGEYFQYQITKAFNGNGVFEFYGVEMQCVPRPQLEVESLVGSGSIQNTW